MDGLESLKDQYSDINITPGITIGCIDYSYYTNLSLSSIATAAVLLMCLCYGCSTCGHLLLCSNLEVTAKGAISMQGIACW